MPPDPNPPTSFRLGADAERHLADLLNEVERLRDFEMMCRRLVRIVPNGTLRDQAMDLLRRKGRSSPLRMED